MYKWNESKTCWIESFVWFSCIFYKNAETQTLHGIAYKYYSHITFCQNTQRKLIFYIKICGVKAVFKVFYWNVLVFGMRCLRICFGFSVIFILGRIKCLMISYVICNGTSLLCSVFLIYLFVLGSFGTKTNL